MFTCLILIKHKVVAMTADDASDMDAAAKKLQRSNSGCFTRFFTITKISVTDSVCDQTRHLCESMNILKLYCPMISKF